MPIDFTPELKSQIVSDIRDYFEHEYSHIPANLACLYWADSAQIILNNYGFTDAQIVAGSATFMVAHDTGSNSTHYSYVFKVKEAAEMLRVYRSLPPLHSWLVLYASELFTKHEVLDLTAGMQIKNAAAHGMHVDADIEYPEYFWCKRHELPATVNYLQHPKATAIARGFVAYDKARRSAQHRLRSYDRHEHRRHTARTDTRGAGSCACGNQG